MKPRRGKPPIKEAIELQIQREEERFHEATHDLEFFRQDALADVGRLARLRRYLWDPIWRRMRAREPIASRTIGDLIRPAWVVDESLKVLGQRVRMGSSGPAEIMTTVQAACGMYEQLVGKSPEAMYLRAVDRAVDRITDLREPYAPHTIQTVLGGAARKPTSRTVAKRLNDERLWHPDGGEWTGDRVVSIAVHLFPGLPAPTTGMSADAGLERLIRRSTGQTLRRDPDMDHVAAFKILTPYRQEPLAALDERVVGIVRARPGIRGAKAVYLVAKPVRKQDVFDSVDRLLTAGRLRSEPAPRNGRRLYAK